MSLPKGVKCGIYKTKGVQKGNFDLYDLRGLSLGKLECIRNALVEASARGSVLADTFECTLVRIFSIEGENERTTE